MKFWNILGTVSRYVLAAVSCISLAQFLLLLNVGTENAGRLAGQSLGRGIISGLVAAVWFYRARKVRPPAPANAQTPALPLFDNSQAQVAPSPINSAPSVPHASVLTADHSGSSFWEKNIRKVALWVLAFVSVAMISRRIGQEEMRATAQARVNAIQAQLAESETLRLANWKMWKQEKHDAEYNEDALLKGFARAMFYQDACARHETNFCVLIQDTYKEWKIKTETGIDVCDVDTAIGCGSTASWAKGGR